MELGTKIIFDDGRVGTVVFNSIIGVGIKWGRHDPNEEDFIGTSGNLVKFDMPEDWSWEPDALLRDPWASCEEWGFTPEECVGSTGWRRVSDD